MKRYLLLMLALLVLSSCNRNSDTSSQQGVSAPSGKKQQLCCAMALVTPVQLLGLPPLKLLSQATALDRPHLRHEGRKVNRIRYTIRSGRGPGSPCNGSGGGKHGSRPRGGSGARPGARPRRAPCIQLPVGTEVAVTNETIDSKKR